MQRLSFILVFFFSCLNLQAQSPHGSDLGMECSACHDAGSWRVNIEGIVFNHDSTGFELEGRHRFTECRLCHQSLVFSQAQPDCFSCHEDVHKMTLGNDCARCHDSETWLVDFIPELHDMNAFPLIGAHSSISCLECHKSANDLVYERIGNECISCHLPDYYATTSPNHVQIGFSTNCIDCHSPLNFDWNADQINHDFFPLVLGHNTPSCVDCHTQSDFFTVSSECSSCHMDDFNSAQSPNHVDLNFSTDCALCHTLNPDWSPADFIDHSFFPLTQGHAIFDCLACHVSDDYSDVSSDCFSCHQTDYNLAQNPNHLNSGFSTDCNDCHTTSPNWEPATFDHDDQYFPIYSGEHRNEWDECTDCHTSPSNFAIFSCFKCHHQGEMNDEHDDVSGYSYNSNKCLHCHPDGDD